MFSKLYTVALNGLDCQIVEVEGDYKRGNFHFAIVGLADKSIQEAKDRIPAAVRNSGTEFIPMQIVMNLAPAELHKSGPSYDLPLAIGFLMASEQLIFDTEKKIFIGELGLDGSLKAVNGILPITDAVKKLGFSEIYLPFENAKEAGLVKDIDIYPVKHLKDLVMHLEGTHTLEKYIADDTLAILNKPKYRHDFSMVKGQQFAKRALEIAAAGGHNILLTGVPGSGKTLLSKCLPSILPDMSLEESLEVTRIYSVAGILKKNDPLIQVRPFRVPHHTSSQVALVGGGSIPKPGEITLAHRGVLFLDEFPEFSSQALEALRQPLEDKIVNISRASGTLTFPSNFMLVAAMNPCKCGFSGDPSKDCKCSPMEIIRYRKKLSGPIIDRFDLLIHVSKVENEKLFSKELPESSETIKARVEKARSRQIDRYKDQNIFSNSDMPQQLIEEFIKLDSESERLLALAVEKMNLSARSYFRILKVARTIADLEATENVSVMHITEALNYRIDMN